jgi:KamA family protein
MELVDMRTYDPVEYRSIPLYADVSPEEWNDWRWQLANVIKDTETLGRVIELDEQARRDLDRCLERFRMAITPYYAALMDKKYELCSVRLQAVPSVREMEDSEADLSDPLFEDVDSPVPGLTHRYPDRVLFLVTNRCSMYCRHCTRRRMVGFEDQHLSSSQIKACIDYIAGHEEVRDVLLSGGDPLVLSDERLESILAELRAIDHVEIIRIGTRMPVVLPMRITEPLVQMIRKYHPVYLNTHFNHYKEITAEAKRACDTLTDAGIPVGNQSVLLRDVNDCPRIMKKLVQELLMIPLPVRPVPRHRALPHLRRPGNGDHREPARAHERPRGPDLRGRRAGRRREDPGHAVVPALLLGQEGHPAQLRGRHHNLHAAREHLLGLLVRAVPRSKVRAGRRRPAARGRARARRAGGEEARQEAGKWALSGRASSAARPS